MTPDPNQEVRSRIEALDLGPIHFRLSHEYGYAPDHIQRLDKWYRRFLYLTFRYPEQAVVVAQAIDDFWHQHILDTAKYAEDCQAAFGRFLHHFPYFGLRGEEDAQALRNAYSATLQLMAIEFGETPERDLGDNLTTLDPVAPSLCSDCGGQWHESASLMSAARPSL